MIQIREITSKTTKTPQIAIQDMQKRQGQQTVIKPIIMETIWKEGETIKYKILEKETTTITAISNNSSNQERIQLQ